jgi:hypothetical protein
MRSSTTTAVQLQVADAAAVNVVGPPLVTDWVRRYVTPWWEAREMTPAKAIDAPRVLATLDPARYADLAGHITARAHREVRYARAPMLLSDQELDGAIVAVSPAQQLVYRSRPAAGALEIIGCSAVAVATATARLARETVRGRLLRSGWAVLHASAVVRSGRTVLTLGGKGAGKTTTALTLARSGDDWCLLANDRVFVRADSNGRARVRVLPWPAAAAVGLGLLDALGWYDIVRDRLQAGEALHPTQDDRVTAALVAGRRAPLWDGTRELKAQLWPHQFADWFGLQLAPGGEATALVFPSMNTAPSAARALSDADFMLGATEDRYPDVLDLVRVPVGGTDTARARAGAQLRALPKHTVPLTHHIPSNTEALSRLLNPAAAG